MAVWGGLINSCEKKRGEKQRRKGKVQASECRVPKSSKKIRKPPSAINAKTKRGKKQNGKDSRSLQEN